MKKDVNERKAIGGVFMQIFKECSNLTKSQMKEIFLPSTTSSCFINKKVGKIEFDEDVFK